jgi:hypothetical protein
VDTGFGEKFIYNPTYSIAFTPPIFTKTAVPQCISVDTCNKFYPNQMKNVENASKISFAP